MASVAENTGEDQENQTILSQSSDLGNEALDEIKQKAKPVNTKRSSVGDEKAREMECENKLDFVVTKLCLCILVVMILISFVGTYCLFVALVITFVPKEN